jgi:hypothetical protein
MKLIKIMLSVSLLLVSGCGSQGTTMSEPSSKPTSNVIHYIVPKTCELPGVNSAFAKIIPPSKYIPTKWQPAAGTDLYSVINSGGIACTYGDQEAEVGGTVMWAQNTNGLWDARVEQWKKDGMIPVDIPGINEIAAYKLPDGATAADGLPAWKVNLLIGDIWIQLGAGFIQSWNEATPIIQAAIDAAK